MARGSTLSEAQKLWIQHARQFLVGYPTREDFLAAVHASNQPKKQFPDRAVRAVQELGKLFDVDLMGLLASIRNGGPQANAFESTMLNQYDTAVQSVRPTSAKLVSSGGATTRIHNRPAKPPSSAGRSRSAGHSRRRIKQ
jgi:hypothetical protein